MTRSEAAAFAVHRYANDAYPAWRRDHPDRICPTHLAELDPYTDDPEHRDPWGRTYVFTCGPSGLFAMSVGADGIASTADDIWSHQHDSR